LPFHLKAEDHRQSGTMTLDFQEFVVNQSLVNEQGNHRNQGIEG